MWKECVSALLDCDRSKSRTLDESRQSSGPLIFVDGTLGGGGHSFALLERLCPGDVVVGCDVDSAALSVASERLSDYLGSQHERLPLFVPVQSNFCQLHQVLPSVQNPVTKEPVLDSDDGLVDGILLDLGLSSHQINTPDRGFAFMKNGPLDMRLSEEQGLTAADVCNEFDAKELEKILKTHGEEPRARAIAQSMVVHRPLQTTSDLVDAVAAVTPEYAKQRRMGRTASLARVFQSIRIVVNEEDKVLNKALMDMSPALLRPGGRLVVLSYHSIEDRSTKRMIRDGTVSPTVETNRKDIYGNFVGKPRPFRSLGKPRKATEEEIERNSRARSATLRVGERV